MPSPFLTPIEQITDRQRTSALRYITGQGISATAMFSVVNNGFLVAYALALGANNFQVGILAALPFVGQPFQIGAIYLVDRFRMRKIIALLAWTPAQLVWVLLALIPLVVATPSGGAVTALLVLMGLRSVLVSFVSTSWNSWLRDVVPPSVLGRYFSRRIALSTVAAVAFGLLSAFAVEIWGQRTAADREIFGYSAVLIFGASTLGLASVVLMGLVPEPRLSVSEQEPKLLRSIVAPVNDPEFRHLVWFLASWSFATSLAIPFFAVHMLVQLEFALPLAIGMLALSQLVSAVFVGTWGTLADRFGFKAVLSLAGSLYLVVILGWVFTALPERHFLTVPLVVVLMFFAGVAAAGVNLALETIGLKLAPQGRSTSYLVVISLAISLGAAVGPILGGRLVDFFNGRELSIIVGWRQPEGITQVPAVSLTGFDFLFALAFILGLPTLLLLRGVRESGEVSHDVVLDELYSQGPGLSRAISLVPGLGLAASIPYTYLRHVPGVNVGVGATLYELRIAVKAAMSGLHTGSRLTSHLTHNLEDRLGHILLHKPIENGSKLGSEVAREIVTSSHAIDITPAEAMEHAIRGSATVMAHAGEPAGMALQAAVHGAVLGAVDSGADASDAKANVFRAARDVAGELGLSRSDASRSATTGIGEAVAEILDQKEAGNGRDEPVNSTP